MSFISENRESESAMGEKELVSYADHGSIVPGKVVSISAEGIIQIDYDVRLQGLYLLYEELDGRQVCGEVKEGWNPILRVF